MCSSGQCTVENGNIFDIGVKKQHDLAFDEIWRTTLLYELCFGLFVFRYYIFLWEGLKFRISSLCLHGFSHDKPMKEPKKCYSNVLNIKFCRSN